MTSGTPVAHGYHHGALREALIAATEELLAERGADGFSLREVARRAGVSPSAPAHHFGDSAGLLTTVATQGFEGLARALAAGNARGGDDARAALREQGVEYVRYALRFPGRFRLMFRSGRLREDQELRRCGRAAYAVLADGVARAYGLAQADGLSPTQHAAVTALWSVVHGYAHLAIAGRLESASCEGGASTPDAAADAIRPVLDLVIAGVFAAT